jgi:hypothetical protein
MGDDPNDRRDELESRDDPDYISEDGAAGAPMLGGGFPSRWGSPPLVFVPKDSTPLEEHDPDGVIPSFALWAMKYRRHGHLFGRADVEIRERYGNGDHTVYVIDDGRKHCVVGRKVGTSADGCTYCLVAQITITAYDHLVDDDVAVDGIYADAREPSLLVVYEAEEAVSNVSLVRAFASIDEVPVEYLPPGPAIVFTEIPDGDG